MAASGPCGRSGKAAAPRCTASLGHAFCEYARKPAARPRRVCATIARPWLTEENAGSTLHPVP